MYVTDYKKEYFNCVVELEKRIYPPVLRLGPDVMQSELGKGRNNSILIFDGGELVGYIIAYVSEKVCYISDLNCTNKRALWLLLSCFFLCRNDEPWDSFTHYEADCRPASFRLLRNRRFGNAIRILRKEEHKDYYCEGEHAYSVAFTVDDEKIKDLRMKIACAILKRESMIDLEAFIGFAKHNGMGIHEMQRYKGFVLRLINDHNLSMYKMLGEKVTVSAEKYKRFKSEYAAEQYGEILAAKGFEKVDNYSDLAHGKYNISDFTLSYKEKSEYSNSKSYGDLSSARFFFRCMYGSGEKVKKVFVVYDKFGAAIKASAPPYCNSRTWEVLINFLAEGRSLDERYASSGVDYRYDYMNRPSYYLKELSKAIGLRDAVRMIDGIIDRKKGTGANSGNNYMHDWNALIFRLIENGPFLTKGAIIACLGGSYNAAVKKADIIEGIGSSVNGTLKGRRKTFKEEFIKDTRSRLSSCIRNGCDLGDLVRDISQKTAKLNAVRYNLTKKETEAADEYIRRMSRYIPYMDTARLFGVMGKTLIKQILSGSVDSVFRPKTYTLGDRKLCEEILELLASGTMQAKHVFTDLNRAGCLQAVKDKALTGSQRAEVMRILKLRNCAVSDEAVSAPDFLARIEPKCSPEYLAAGNATVCCMGFGSRKAIYYAQEEGFGILNVYYKDRIIANSVLWIEDSYNCLVIDNIEVHPNYTVYNGQIEQLYMIAVSDMQTEYHLNFTVQGNGYSDLDLKLSSDFGIMLSRHKARKIKNPNFYSDARQTHIVCSAISDDSIRVLHEQVLADAA